jgi:iron complex outermembrane recepter protein
VLENDELLRRLSTSVPATIARVPGIAQQYNGPAATQPVIRGMGGDRVLVLEEGLRTGDIAATSDDHTVAIEPVTARRIERLLVKNESRTDSVLAAQNSHANSRKKEWTI